MGFKSDEHDVLIKSLENIFWKLRVEESNESRYVFEYIDYFRDKKIVTIEFNKPLDCWTFYAEHENGSYESDPLLLDFYEIITFAAFMSELNKVKRENDV